MHNAPVAEGDAAQARCQRAGCQAVQLSQRIADLDMALMDMEARILRMLQALWRADVRAEGRMEGQVPCDILRGDKGALSCHHHQMGLQMSHGNCCAAWHEALSCIVCT